MKPAIRFCDVTFRHGKRTLFDHVNLDLGRPDRGSITALVGPSGIGKSTFIRLAAGLLRPHQGRIELARGARDVSMLAQEPVIFDHLTAIENAHYLLNARSGNGASSVEMASLTDALQLHGVLEGSTAASDLSGGERQRLAILRALSVHPAVLLLDEPCAGLDPQLRAGVMDGMQRAVSESQATILYVTHHVDEIALASDQVLFFERPASEEATVAIRLLSTTDFLVRPPTLSAARFALFPRCNVVHGRHVGGGGFVLTNAADVGASAIAALPDQIALVEGEVGMAGFSFVSQRSEYLWLDWKGTLMAKRCHPQEAPLKTVGVRIVPGAMLYDSGGQLTEVSRHPIDLIVK